VLGGVFCSAAGSSSPAAARRRLVARIGFRPTRREVALGLEPWLRAAVAPRVSGGGGGPAACCLLWRASSPRPTALSQATPAPISGAPQPRRPPPLPVATAGVADGGAVGGRHGGGRGAPLFPVLPGGSPSGCGGLPAYPGGREGGGSMACSRCSHGAEGRQSRWQQAQGEGAAAPACGGRGAEGLPGVAVQWARRGCGARGSLAAVRSFIYVRAPRAAPAGCDGGHTQ
jgi:hypothetical protein